MVDDRGHRRLRGVTPADVGGRPRTSCNVLLIRRLWVRVPPPEQRTHGLWRRCAHRSIVRRYRSASDTSSASASASIAASTGARKRFSVNVAAHAIERMARVGHRSRCSWAFPDRVVISTTGGAAQDGAHTR